MIPAEIQKFIDARMDELLAVHSKVPATLSERHVKAVENIADSLSSLAQIFWNVHAESARHMVDYPQRKENQS